MLGVGNGVSIGSLDLKKEEMIAGLYKSPPLGCWLDLAGGKGLFWKRCLAEWATALTALLQQRVLCIYVRAGQSSSACKQAFFGFFFKVKIPGGQWVSTELKNVHVIRSRACSFLGSWFLWSMDLNKSNFLMFGPLCMSINLSLFREDLLWWGVAQWDSRWAQDRRWGAYAIKMNNKQKQTNCKSSIWSEVGATWAEPNRVLVSLFSLYLRCSAGGLFTSRHFSYSSLAIAADFTTYLKTHSIFSSQNCWYTKQQWLHNSWRPNTKILHSTNIAKFQI